MALRSNLPSPGFDSSYRVYGEIFSICFVFRSSNSSCITEFFPSFIRLKKKQAFSVHLGSSPALYQLILRTGPKFYQIRVEVLGEFLFVFRRYLLACWERLLKRLCWRNGHAYRQWGQVRAWWSMVLAWTHRRRCRSIGDRLLHRSGVGVFFFTGFCVPSFAAPDRLCGAFWFVEFLERIPPEDAVEVLRSRAIVRGISKANSVLLGVTWFGPAQVNLQSFRLSGMKMDFLTERKNFKIIH